MRNFRWKNKAHWIERKKKHTSWAWSLIPPYCLTFEITLQSPFPLYFNSDFFPNPIDFEMLVLKDRKWDRVNKIWIQPLSLSSFILFNGGCFWVFTHVWAKFVFGLSVLPNTKVPPYHTVWYSWQFVEPACSAYLHILFLFYCQIVVLCFDIDLFFVILW